MAREIETEVGLTIWVDADACPNMIKNVLFRLADKRRIKVVLISNHFVKAPNSRYVTSKQVRQGFDEADNEIVALMCSGDVVITGDLPLANDVITKNGHTIQLPHAQERRDAVVPLFLGRFFFHIF